MAGAAAVAPCGAWQHSLSTGPICCHSGFTSRPTFFLWLSLISAGVFSHFHNAAVRQPELLSVFRESFLNTPARGGRYACVTKEVRCFIQKMPTVRAGYSCCSDASWLGAGSCRLELDSSLFYGYTLHHPDSKVRSTAQAKSNPKLWLVFFPACHVHLLITGLAPWQYSVCFAILKAGKEAALPWQIQAGVCLLAN